MIPDHPIFNEFLAEYPHLAVWDHIRMMPGGVDLCISKEAMGTFLHWCVVKGYAGPQAMTSFLTDVVPHMRPLSADDRSRATRPDDEPAVE